METTAIHTPHPGPLPVEGRGRGRGQFRAGGPISSRSDVAGRSVQAPGRGLTLSDCRAPAARSLSPQRGEGRGEGWEYGWTSDPGRERSSPMRP